MTQKLTLAALLITIHVTFCQVIPLIDEDFNEGMPTNWTHCSGNWGKSPQWYTSDTTLTISSGPYFGRVLDGIQLPVVDLTSVSNPVLELDLAMMELDTNIQFSVYHSTDSSCITEWDNNNSFHDFSNKEILASFSPEGDGLKYRHITIDLSTLSNESKIFFTLTADCMNNSASGVWHLDNLKISGSPVLNTEAHLDDITLQISPNPANTMLKISGAKNDYNYSILNTTGSIVLTGIGNKIDISNLSNGLYFLISNNQSMKFIKE